MLNRFVEGVCLYFEVFLDGQVGATVHHAQEQHATATATTHKKQAPPWPFWTSNTLPSRPPPSFTRLELLSPLLEE